MKDHPVLRGVEAKTIWGPSDVYGVRLPLPGDSEPLVLGAVLEGMQPGDQPIEGEKNDPLMPIIWTKTYTSDSGAIGKVVNTTIGIQGESIITARRSKKSTIMMCLVERPCVTTSARTPVGQRRPTLHHGSIRRRVAAHENRDANHTIAPHDSHLGR